MNLIIIMMSLSVFQKEECSSEKNKIKISYNDDDHDYNLHHNDDDI